MSENSSEIRVRSIADLLPLLDHANPEVRTAAYRSLLENPEKARALAADNGRDIVDVLIGRVKRHLSQREKVPLLMVLGQFQDSRVDDIFLDILTLENRDEMLHIAARYAKDTGLNIPTPELLILLRCDYNMSKVRIAAELLVGREGLNSSDWIRVAAFSSGRADFPALNAETVDAWMEQLNSPLRDYMCLVLETTGPELEDWHILWPALDATLQNWVVRRACKNSPAVDSIIRRGLDSESDAVRSSSATAIRLYGTHLDEETQEAAI